MTLALLAPPAAGGYVKSQADLSAKFFDSWRLELYAGGWVDISADLLSRPDPSAEWGIKGSRVDQRVASPGQMQFTLNNSSANSAGLAGYYSPGHVNCRPGFVEGAPVRWVYTYDGLEYVRGIGEIGSIAPAPGRHGARNTQVIAFDYMKRLSEFDTVHTLPVLAEATSDQAYEILLNALTAQPPHRSLTSGVDTFDFLLVAALGDRPAALAEIARISRSGLEYVFVTGDGTFKNQTRHQRFKTRAVKAWINIWMTEMEAPETSEANIVDVVSAEYSPYATGVAVEQVYQLDTPFSLAPGRSHTFVAPYTDPDVLGKRVAVTALDDTLEADTNYTFGATPGADNSLNDDLVVSVVDGVTAAAITIRNSSTTQTGWVNTLMLEGIVYRTTNPQQAEGQARGRTGNRALRLDLKYVSDFNLARGFAQFAADVEGESAPRLKAVTFSANRSHEAMLAALTVDIGDRVRITEPQSGIDGLYYVNHVSWELRAGKLMWMTWELEAAKLTQFAICDISRCDAGARVAI